MSSTLRRRLAWILAAWVALVVFGLTVAEMADSLPPEDSFDSSTAAFLAANVAAMMTGAVVAVRKPRHPIGSMLLLFGLGGAVAVASFGVAAMLADAGSRTAAAWFEGVGAASLTATFVSMPAAVLLFPNGELPSPRWRPVGWAMALAAGTGFFAALLNGGFGGDAEDAIFGPVVSESYAGLVDIVSFLSFVFLVLSVLGAGASLIVRFRRSSGEEHQQMKWVAAAAVFLGFTIVVVALEAGAGTATGWVAVLLAAGLASIPTAMALAILRYRLYDIDIVISKSVAYLGLAAVITLLYAAVVVGPLLVIGESDGGDPGLALPIAATALVAVLFEPIRSRMQRWANRLVYGERSTPHEVLSQLTAQLSETGHNGGTNDLAKLLAEGTGAAQAVVWRQRGAALEPEGMWPPGGSAAPLMAQDLIDDDVTARASIRHGEDLLGALSITKPRNDPVTPADRELISDVAAGAGLVLRNIGLNRQLEERARQVRESRLRLIAAQDAERHRLERDLHDGAQQQVVALKVKLGLAKTIAERAGADDVASLISGLTSETQQAVDALRAVAHGIYPPLLEAEGLEVALRAVERTSASPLVIETTGLTRYERPVEETVYFCVLEALEQVRMSGAHSVRVAVTDRIRELTMEIDYDGRGTETDLTAVSDRVDAFGGTTGIELLPGDLTRIASRVPVGDLELA